MENVKRGKLKLKGKGELKVASKLKTRKNKKNDLKRCSPEEGQTAHETCASVEVDDMTPAQRRHAEHKKKREQEEIEKMASKTYRERIEELNQHLGSLTEHHDVPRVSAAGNG